MARRRCVRHPKDNGELCMGCGHYFCEECSVRIRGLVYCKKCAKEIGAEYAKIKERYDLDSTLPGTIQRYDDEPDTWGAGPKGSVSPENVSKLRGVPLKGIIAGIEKRLAARAIDLVIFLGVLCGGAGYGAYYFREQLRLPSVAVAWGVGLGVGLVLGIIVRAVFLIAGSTTPGRMFRGLRVVTKRGKFISTGIALSRTLFETLEMIFPVISLINFYRVKPEMRQGSIADSWTGTLVVNGAAWHKRAVAQLREAKKGQKKARKVKKAKTVEKPRQSVQTAVPGNAKGKRGRSSRTSPSGRGRPKAG